MVVGDARVNGIDDAHRLIDLRLCRWHPHLGHQTASSEGHLATPKTWPNGQTIDRIEEGHADLTHSSGAHDIFAC